MASPGGGRFTSWFQGTVYSPLLLSLVSSVLQVRLPRVSPSYLRLHPGEAPNDFLSFASCFRSPPEQPSFWRQFGFSLWWLMLCLAKAFLPMDVAREMLLLRCWPLGGHRLAVYLHFTYLGWEWVQCWRKCWQNYFMEGQWPKPNIRNIYLIISSVIDWIGKKKRFGERGPRVLLFFKDGHKCLNENKSQKCEIRLWIFICIFLLTE